MKQIFPKPQIHRLKLLALLALPFAFFWQETLGRSTLASGDVAMFFYPLVRLAAEQLRAGQWPWWNPGPFGGLPLLTNLQAGLLDPCNWPLLFSPTGPMLTLTQMLTFVLALCAAYACARSMGLLRQASAVTAVIYAFNGFLVGRLLYPSTPRSYALAPLVICCIERLWRGGGRREVILGGLVVAWQLLAGHPQMLVYSALLACGYALFCALLRRQEDVFEPSAELPAKPAPLNKVRFLGHCLLIYVLGGLLSAIQLLPAIELSRYSIRPHYRFEEFALNSLHPVTWLTALIPFWHGGAGGVGPYKMGFWGAYWHHNETVLYLGPLALSLALAGAWLVVRARNRAGVFWLAATGVSLLLASGAYLDEAARLYQRYTLLGGFRCANRWWMVAALTTALLAGVAVDWLLRSSNETPDGAALRRIARLMSGLLLALCSIIALSVWRWPALVEGWVRNWTGWDLSAGFLRNAPAEFYVPVVMASVALLVLLFFTRVQPQRWCWLLLLVLLADYQLYALVTPIRSSTGFEPLLGTGFSPQLAAQQNAAEPVRYHLLSEPGPDAFDPFWYYGHELTVGRDPLILWRYRELTGIDEAGFSQRLDLVEARNRVLDLLNVRYLAVRPQLAERLKTAGPRGLYDPARWRPRADLAGTTGLHIFENQQALPRAWLVSQAASRDETQQQAILRGERRDEMLGDFDPLRVALLEPAAQTRVNPLLFAAQPSAATGQVSIVARQADRMRLQTRHTQPNLLVLSEPWFPGWHATVDGKPAEILRVDYLLRGIALPSGAHTVELRFRPVSLLVGAGISASTWLALAVLWWRQFQQRKLKAKRIASSE